MSARLHVVEVDVEDGERLGEGRVASRQPAESLGGVRLHGVIRLSAAAHRAAQLLGRRQCQTAHFRHAKPEPKTDPPKNE